MAVEFINSKADFDETIKEGKFFLNFFATWCGPCKMLAPVLDELAPELEAEGIRVIKVDVDQAPEVAEAYKVMSIPTSFLIKDGETVATEQGFKPINQLREWTKQL